MSRIESVAIQIPGFIAGTWEVDPVHSEVSFVVRHLVVSKVRGRFDRFSGTIITNEDLARSSVHVTIDASSVNTNDPQTNAVPRTTEITVRTRRTLWAPRLRNETFRIADAMT